MSPFESTLQVSSQILLHVQLEIDDQQEFCIQGSWSPLHIWDILIVNVTSTSRVVSLDVDSPDSSTMRMVTYLVGKFVEYRVVFGDYVGTITLIPIPSMIS